MKLNQHKGGLFKLALPDRWLVVVNGKKLVDELHRFSDDYVSLTEGVGEVRLLFDLDN